MAEPISIQQLKDASLDVKSLEEVVNGDDTVIVTTRLGETYPSVKGSIKTLFENGGIPATPFATKALMIASALVDGQYAMVTDGGADNGLYVKIAGEWVKSAYDPLAQAKTYTDTKSADIATQAKEYTNYKTQGISEQDVGDALFAKVDSSGNIIEVTAKDGSQYLTGLDGSVQENLSKSSNDVNEVKELIGSLEIEGITLAFVDKREQVFAYFSDDADLVLTGLEGSVQSNINENKETSQKVVTSLDVQIVEDIAIAFADSKENVIAYFKNNAHLFLANLSDSVQNEINANKKDLLDLANTVGMTEVATVKGLVKGDYTVDAATILSMKIPATNNMSFYKTDSPYHKDDDFVHPCVIELSEPMRGYSYLMCITPYRGRDPLVENPTIYGSNDQVNWTMLTGFTQPIDNPPEWDEPESGEHGWLSDNWWAYDPIEKELYCCYRKGYYADYPNGYKPNDRMQLLYRKTTNGLTWSKPVMFTPETTAGNDGQVAPSLVYDKVNSRWVMTYLKQGDWKIYVRFNTELTVEGWSEPVEIGFNAFANANNIKAWHVETKFIGNKLFMLIGDSVNGRYYFAYANDDTYLSWTFSANSVLPDTWTRGAYKGSFIEVPQADGTIKIRMYWTDTAIGKIYSNLSPSISII